MIKSHLETQGFKVGKRGKHFTFSPVRWARRASRYGPFKKNCSHHDPSVKTGLHFLGRHRCSSLLSRSCATCDAVCSCRRVQQRWAHRLQPVVVPADGSRRRPGGGAPRDGGAQTSPSGTIARLRATESIWSYCTSFFLYTLQCCKIESNFIRVILCTRWHCRTVLGGHIFRPPPLRKWEDVATYKLIYSFTRPTRSSHKITISPIVH